MYEVIRIHALCMGKNSNGLVYCRLINTTLLCLLTTVMYFLYCVFDIVFMADTVLFLSLILPCRIQ